MLLPIRGPRCLHTDGGGVSASQESVCVALWGVQWVLEYSLHVVVIERAGVNCGICAFVREELLGDGFLLQLCRLISVLASRCRRSSGPGEIVDRCMSELSLAAFVYCHDCM